jgi:hypothetical protein
MWIGNIDRCWEVMQEVWSRRNQVEKAKAEEENLRRPRHDDIIHSENSKRKFEEDIAIEEGFGFSDRVNDSDLSTKRQRASFSGAFSGAFSSQGKRRQEPITEELDPELTVRGGLHWVGVMKDWNWESKCFSSTYYRLSPIHLHCSNWCTRKPCMCYPLHTISQFAVKSKLHKNSS